MSALALHLEGCGACRKAAARPARRRAAILYGLTVLIAVIALFTLTTSSRRTNSAAFLTELFDRLPDDSRPTEARINGAAWAPYKSGEAAARPTLVVQAAATAVMRAARDETTPAGSHAAAVAYLVTGRFDQAVSALANPATPAAWNDLAVAQLAVADMREEPARLGKALMAADAALRLEPKLAEALFNRALVIERLGLRDLAREAWEHYVSVDTDSRWAVEAREHIRLLQPEVPFKTRLERDYERLASDAEFVRGFVRSSPQESRRYGETEILARWASAETAGDRTVVGRHLAVARSFGKELAVSSGERLLTDAVAAIDRADSTTRALLASGHLAFREAQQEYRANKAARAHVLFLRAAEQFERGDSPATLLARYFVSSTMFDGGATEESRMLLEELLAKTPAEYHACRAQMQWQLGRVYALDGRWGDALDTLALSVAGFERLGELHLATSVREIMAEIYDRIGDPASAWLQRVAALRELGRETTPRLQLAMTAMTRAAMANEEWAEAASFLALELDVARRGRTPVRSVEILLLRARLNQRSGNASAARADVADAQAVIAQLDDPAISVLLEAEAITVDAMLAETPREAVSLLTAAIDSFRARGRKVFVPELLLHRGRSYAAAGDRTRAAADYEAGITELEASRESLPAGRSRWGVFDASAELFEEAVVLALSGGDAGAAFRYSDRARARQLLDTMPGASSVTSAPVPVDTAVVEYMSLPERLVIFVFDRSGIRVVEHPISRENVRNGAARFTEAVRRTDGKDLYATGVVLHKVLFEPIARLVASKTHLVFVPDNAMGLLPFAALLDEQSGRYLIEDHSLVIAPSAAAYVRLSERNRTTGEQRLLVMAAGDADSTQPALPAARREAALIARLYANAKTLAGDQATATAFGREAPAATMIHFAGHAVAARTGSATLVLSNADGGGRRVDATSIAAMDLRRTSLVVLAGCDTAGGETRASEGTISLARAFLGAGVRSVVATLQPIADDEAADFFPRLHEHLVRGASPAEAVRSVQIERIRRSGTQSATWAAVQVIGS